MVRWVNSSDRAMKLNPLPRGVTGFSALDREATPAFDAAGFTAASYQVMRQLGGKVVSIDTDLVARITSSRFWT